MDLYQEAPSNWGKRDKFAADVIAHSPHKEKAIENS